MAQVLGFDHHRFEAERFRVCLDEAHRLLIQAADEWAKGHPELRPTRQVLQEILRIFADNEFLSRPYGWNAGNDSFLDG